MPAAGTEEKRNILINISKRKKIREEKDVLKITLHRNARETEIYYLVLIYTSE